MDFTEVMTDPYFIFDFPRWPAYLFASLLGLAIVMILFRFIYFDKKYWLCWAAAVEIIIFVNVMFWIFGF